MRALLELPLGPAVGQCCGGHVTLALRARRRRRRWRRSRPRRRRRAASLPAGAAVRRRPCRPGAGRGRWRRCRCGCAGSTAARTSFPSRRSRAPRWSSPAGRWPRSRRHPAGSACFVLTHSHASTSTLCSAVLERGDFAYLGLIGSAHQARQVRARLSRARHPAGARSRGWSARSAATRCATSGRPVIAALAAAELLIALARAAIGPTHAKAAGRAATERAA